MKENWMIDAPPLRPEEEGINPPHLQRLMYNPNYYHPDEKDLKIGEDIVIGQYASNTDGSPNIRWREVVIENLPLHEDYPQLVYFMKQHKQLKK